MKRMKEMHHYERSNRIGWMVWPICIVLAVMGSFLLIDTIAIDDVNEAASSRHVGNIPVGVTKLSADSYLIEDSAKVTPFDICKGSNAEGSGAKSTYDSQLARYKAIQAAYARDEINDLEFDKKLQTLVDDGFTLPDSGIFEKKT